jgi:signal transduction histidine kinase
VYVGTGVVAFIQRRDNRAARRLLAFGCSYAVPFAVGYAYSALVAVSGVPAWSGVMAAVLRGLGWWLDAAALAMAAVFPDGRYSRRYERVAVRTAWCTLTLALLAWVAGTDPLSANTPYVWDQGDVSGPNPFVVPGWGAVGRIGDVALNLAPLALLAAAVVLVLRYRRSAPEVRRQIAWPLYSLALTVAAMAVLGALSSWINRQPYWLGFLLFYPVLLLIPVGLLIGMRRHQLLDINLVVRRSAVYGVLWTLITVAYIGVAAAFGVLVGRRLPVELAVVLTILATIVAAPARRRLERLADRVVYGRRSSGYEMISRLGARLEASLAPEDVAGAVARGVRDGLGSRWVRVVLASGGVAATAGHAEAEPALVVCLGPVHDRLGAIECGPKVDGGYRPADEELLRTLARQATLALGNAALTAELSERLAELEASRARLVEAEEAGRRRIERDLHDGVQQELVALLTRVSMVRQQLRRDPRQAAQTLDQVQADTRRALESLQDLVRGIHPPLLTDGGLREAVEELVTRMPIAAEVRVAGWPEGFRADAGIEGAAYFVVSEAVGNALKHADASRVCISLALRGGVLALEIGDDGGGFVPEGVEQWGLRGLRDRVDALGGRLRLDTAPGRGTRVCAELPVPEVARV